VVRGSADVHLPAGAGHHGDRPGPRPALRADRGAHDDLHPRPARPPAPGRDPRPQQARLGGAADPADHGGDHGRGGEPAAAGGARRDRGPRPPGVRCPRSITSSLSRRE
jgi:hypothetical protein